MILSRIALLAAGAALLSLSATAGTSVRVTVTGTVEYNQISGAPLSGASSGDPAELSFLVDSDDFADDLMFPTRGYVIDQSSFSMVINGGAVDIGLQSPFPAAETPYFVLRNNDPAVDGFFLATNTNSPNGLPLAQAGVFGQFRDNFSVGYDGATLSSLDILDAVGTYDFTGISSFNWTIDDGPSNAMGLIFAELEIALEGPSFYCTGKLNSQGCTPFLTSDAGIPSLSGGPWNVQSNMLINNKNGLFFYALAPGNAPFSGGTLCVTPPLARTTLQNAGGNAGPDDCSGQLSVDLPAEVLPGLVPATFYVQSWGRDPQDATGFGTSLSNGIQVPIEL